MSSKNSTPPPEQDMAGIAEDELPTNQEAIPVPYLRGRRAVAIRWISPILNQRSVQREEDVK